MPNLKDGSVVSLRDGWPLPGDLTPALFVSAVPGEIAICTGIDDDGIAIWQTLTPGTVGQVLAIGSNGLPAWQDGGVTPVTEISWDNNTVSWDSNEVTWDTN